MKKNSTVKHSYSSLSVLAGNFSGSKSSLRSTLAILAALGACAAWLLATEARAAETEWIGGSNNWKNASSWNPSGVPSTTDLAIFDDASTAFAGPNGSTVQVAIGAILLEGDRTTTQTIYPFGSTTGTGLTLNSYSYDFGDGPVNLLLGNTSAATLAIGGRSGADMAVILGNSGVIYSSGSQISIGSAISDNGYGYTITETGAGLVNLGSLAGNSTYSGGFILEGGTLESYGSTTVTNGVLVSGPFGIGTLTLSGGTLKGQSATSNRLYANAVALNGSVALGAVGDGGTLTFSNAAGNTTTLVQDSTLTVNTANVLWQQGISGGYGLTKAGTGNLTLAAGSSGTYTGPTTVAAGALYVDGFLFSSPVEVQSGATFGGAGQVNNTISVLGGGTLAPGSRTAVGTLSTAGALSLESGAHIQFDLSTAISYDALAASSPVSLDGADLVLTLGYQPSAGDAFVLIENNSGEAIDGLLSYEGTILHDGDLFSVTSGGFTQEFQIDYDYEADGFGDNLAITALSVPEPSTWGLLGLGTVVLGTFSRRLRRVRALSGANPSLRIRARKSEERIWA